LYGHCWVVLSSMFRTYDKLKDTKGIIIRSRNSKERQWPKGKYRKLNNGRQYITQKTKYSARQTPLKQGLN